MYSKKALFPLQMCHIPKNTKAIPKMFHIGLDLYLLTICTILLGKVEETRNIRAGENDLTINIFSFKFYHLYLGFEARFVNYANIMNN